MDALKILCWNLRGAVDVTHRANLKRLVWKNSPTLICLQETKCQLWNDFMKSSIWNKDDHGWLEVAARGLSGGLLITWDNSVIECVSHSVSSNWILFKGRMISSGMEFSCINIYAPPVVAKKVLLWEELLCVIQRFESIPMVLIGDFNSVRRQSERVSCQYAAWDSSKFNEFFEKSELIEVNGDPGFTWFGPANKCSVLDRALATVKWLEQGNWYKSMLSRMNSDHKPLLLLIQGLNWGPTPFRFFDWWLKDPSFLRMIDDFWLFSSQFSWTNKVKSLREKIKQWNRQNNGDIEGMIRKLEETQSLADKDGWDDLSKMEIRDKLVRLYEGRASSIKQKARLNWGKFGDKNTRFFHNCVVRRRKKIRFLEF